MNESELIRRAMVVLGSRKSEAKAHAARENGKRGGRPPGAVRALEEFECRCKAAPDAPDSAHKTYCPRGRAWRRRHPQNADAQSEAKQ
jgi:hypothetical protein